MKDSPSSIELLEAVANALTDHVLPETSGQTRHTVRVAANLCRIVGRELAGADGAEADRAVVELLGGGPDDDLARLLDERLQADNPTFDAALADFLFADVCRRVDVAKPGYRDSDS